MRARDVVPLLALALLAQPAQSQKLGDRLKKMGITVKSGKDTAKSPSAETKNASAAAAPVMPTSSKAHPDVSGVVLGVTTAKDIREMFARNTALLVGKDRMGVLVSKPDPRSSQATRVPNTAYVGAMRAGSKAYSTRKERPIGETTDEIISNMREDYFCGAGADETRGNCEDWTLRFALHPAETTVIGMMREIKTAPSPLGDNVEKSVIEKYGEPTVRTSDERGRRELVWIYKDDGSVMPGKSSSTYECVRAAHEMFKYVGSSGGFDVSSYADPFLTKGCVAAVSAVIEAPNNVTKTVVYRAVDAFGWRMSQDKANLVIADFEKKQRDAAANVKPPNE